MLRLIAAVSLCLCVSLPANSVEDSSNSRLIQQARDMALSERDVWRKLLLYEVQPDLTLLSAVHSRGFFNAFDGATNPESELQATLMAFSKPVTTDPNQHAQCKFRGRFFWLRQQLGFTSELIPEVYCPDYEDWSLHNTTQSISVMFVTGYLGNPASYFGHTLLKLNSNAKSQSTKLEDVTVNYGAIIPEGEGPVEYIFKGLTGGYEAGFSQVQYFFHDHNYGENEHRDLWEYEVNLSESELELVLGHSWELISQKFTYYFTRKNCAYRMAEVLEIIDGVDIIPEGLPWLVPQALIQNLNKQIRNNEPLVKSVKYHPSRQSRLYEKYSQLPQPLRNWIHDLVADPSLINAVNFESLALEDKHLLLDVLLDYYQYVRKPDELDQDSNNIRYRQVLTKRFELPAGVRNTSMQPRNFPHKGRGPSLFSMGLIENSKHGRGLRLRGRPVYYDALDSDYGHVKHASLSMGELELIVWNEKVQLRRLDIFKVESVNSAVTGLPGDTGKSWVLGFGVERRSLSCSQCTVAKFQGSVGHTLYAGENIVAGGFVGGAIQQSKGGEGALYANASFYADIDLVDDTRLRVVGEYREFPEGGYRSRWIGGVHARYKLESDKDIRLSVEHDEATEVSLGVSWYF